MYSETLSKETALVLRKIKDTVPNFYLAGGTALALEFGHRISVDLDFFSENIFSTPLLVEKLNNIGKLKIEDQSEDTFNGTLDGVKISFFYYPYPILFNKKNYEGVALADERDIAAMKIQAISGRGSKKDFIDLFELLSKFSLSDILKFFSEKYIKYNYNMLHILKSLDYFNDADSDPEPVYLKPISWGGVKLNIKKVVNEYIKSQV